ncbi:Uncharacterised protein [Mycobacterium tuberculosis]|nr:Uncharacterised protein [Mycobacterium tuberculosis]
MSAARTTRTGAAVSHDMIHIKRNPPISVADDTISTPYANWMSVKFCSTISRIPSKAIPKSGTPELSSHTTMVRPMIPSANRPGGSPASSAWAATGRRANSVSM